MATQKVKVVYVTNVKTRTVVKVTVAVCATALACRVAGEIATPHIVKLNHKLTSMLDAVKEPDVVVSRVDIPVTIDE